MRAVVLSSLLIFCSSVQADEKLWVPGQYIVEVDESAVLNLDAEPLGAQTFKINLNPFGAQSVTPVEVSDTDIARCDAIKAANPAITTCSPNYLVSTMAVPNDPGFSTTWGLQRTSADAESAWDVTTGSSDVVVAVVDTGVDYNHPDLIENTWSNPRESANGVDDDGNGIVDDLHGINAMINSGDPADDHGHGTHCAGTIGARGNNGIGVAGVSWNVKIMGVKFMGANGSGDLSGAIRGINYVVDQKKAGVNVSVMNNSWGGGGFSQPLYNAIARAHDAGIVFVAAAGNSANNNDESPSYPASYELPNVISVAAVSEDGSLASFSNFGVRSVDIGAPGVNIVSTAPGGGYARMSGTSMATPHIAGALGLLLGFSPTMTHTDAIARVLGSSVRIARLASSISEGRSLSVSRTISGDTTTPPTLPQCKYTVASVPFSRTDDAFTGAVLDGSVSDDVGVAVNASFPFFGQTVSSVTASTNQILYFGRQRDSSDYDSTRNFVSSLAFGHADWVQKSGIRSSTRADGSTVFGFIGSMYGIADYGSLRVAVVLYPSGVIDVFTQGSADLLELLGEDATVSLAGPGGETFKRGISKPKSGTRFTPSCGSSVPSPDPVIEKVRLKLSSREVRVSLRGSGSGEASLRFTVSGKSCSKEKKISIKNGRYDRSIKLPSSTGTLSIKASAGAASGSSTLNKRTRVSKLTKKAQQLVCKALTK